MIAARARELVRSPRFRLWGGAGLLTSLRALVLVTVAGFSVHALGPPSTTASGLAPGTRSIVLSLFHWDAVKYVAIARRGYGDPTEPAYFPLYPLLVRVVHLLTNLSYTHSALVVSWVAAYLLTVALIRLCAVCLHQQHWQRVVLLVLFAPASFFLFSGYPESVVALLFTLVLICVCEEHFGRAALVAAAASAAAPLGAFLVVPILVGMVQSPVQRQRWLRSITLLAVSELGLLGYIIFLARRYDSPLAFLDAQKYWNRQTTLPFRSLFWSINKILRGQPIGNPAVNGNTVAALGIDDLVTVAAVVGVVALMWKIRGRDFLKSPLLPALSIGFLVLMFNVTNAAAGGVSPEALARHLGIVVPFYLPAAMLGREETFVAVLIPFVVLGTLAQVLFCYGLWFT